MANVVEVIFRGVDQISRNTSQINNSLTTLRRSALRLGVALAGAFAVRELAQHSIRALDTFTLVENRIRLVTDSIEELNSVQERLFRVAQETRSAFAPTVELYARVARSTKDLGISQQEVIDLTKTVNQAIQISGATAQEASAGVIQFAQALASGELRGEELRSVMEQLSGLSLVLARGLGVGVGELRDMAEAGELTAEKIISVLRDEAPKVQAEFEQITPTIAGAFQTLQNSLAKFNSQMGEATGSTNLLTTALQGLAKGIDAVGEAVFDTELENLQEQLADIEAQIIAIRNPSATSIKFGLFPTESFEELAAAAAAVRAEIDALQNRERSSGLDLIEVDSAANLEKLSEALARFRENAEDTAKDIADRLIREFEPIEDRIARELREVDIAAHLIPDDLEARMRERIKAQRLEGLAPIIVEDIVDVEAMDRRLAALLDHSDETFDQLEAIADEAARSMQRAFSDFFFDPFKDGLEGMVEGFLNAIRRMLADEAAVRFFNLLSGKGSGSSGGILGGIFKAIGGLFGGGGGTGPLGPPRAHGGFTMPGLMHPVNEREPEFLLTRGRSEVVPLSKMAANGKGGRGIVFSPHTELNLLSQPMTRDQIEGLLDARDAKLFSEFKRTLRDDGLD